MLSIITDFFQQKPTKPSNPTDRYAWLEERMRKAIKENEDIDHIYRVEFSKISFANTHTEENYKTLLTCVNILNNVKPFKTNSALYVKGNFSSIASEYASCYQTGKKVFLIDTICKLVNTIPPDNDATEPWEIVYKMCILLIKDTWTDTSMVNNTYDNLRKKIKNPDMVDKPYFHYLVGVYDEIGVVLGSFGSFGKEPIMTEVCNARMKLRSDTYHPRPSETNVHELNHIKRRIGAPQQVVAAVLESE